MDNSKRTNAVDIQLHLPEAIVQRILSLLSRKQAASTALVSKSWYNSWLTRPILDLDERDFQNDDEFVNFATRSMQRYHELNLSLQSFKLWMNVRDVDASVHATELIVKAVQIGAKDINLRFNPPFSKFILPNDLFESDSLVGLSAVGCRIYGSEVMCSRLKSLFLYKVTVQDDMIRDIMSRCPALEDLFLSECEGLVNINLGGMINLKKFSVVREVSKPGGWKIPLIEFEEQRVESVFGDRPKVSEFSNLSYLLLERVKIPEMLFCDFSNKFSCIKDLTVRYCDDCVRFDISSHSLIHISLAHVKKLEIQLDVPSIRKFKFSGATIPSLSLVTASREWESNIEFTSWHNLDFSWFFELKELLSNLGLSKITIRINLMRGTVTDRLPDFQDFPKPIVENLTLQVHPLTLACVALLDGIFWSLQPKIITHCLFPVLDDKRGKANTGRVQPEYWQANNELLQLLCKKLMELESSHFCNSDEKRFGMHELEEVNAEIFEDMHMQWQSLPWKTLLDALMSSEKEAQIRFRLRWAEPELTEPNHGQLV